MKTLTKRLFTIILSVIVFSFTTNCKQDDLTNEVEEVQEILEEPNGMPIETRTVNVNDVSGLSKYLRTLSAATQSRVSGDNLVVTPFGNIPLENITEVIDTLGNANYTFAIIPSVYRENKFFNLIVHQEPEEDFSSFVMEYDLDNTYANNYYNGDADLSNFHGSMRSYSSEEFLAMQNSEGNRTVNLRACGEDTETSSEPCNEADVDNSNGPASNDGTGDGSGVGDSDNGDPIGDEGPGDTDGGSDGGGPVGASRPCWATLYIVNCGGSNSSVGHPLSSCQGPQDLPNEEVYFVNTCGSGVQRTASRVDIGCPIGGGAVAVSPVPFASLATALGLTSAEDLCLSSAANCEHKNEIYDYLNANILPDGSGWEQDALGFAGLVLDELFDDCTWDFEVDYDDNIIYDSSFDNFPCHKLIVEEATGTCSPLTQLILNAFEANDGTNLIFKVSDNISANANTSTVSSYNATTHTCNITIKFRESYLQTATDLSIARTAIHESVHAVLVYMFEENLLQSPTGETLDGFEDFVEAYVSYIGGLPINAGSTHHELMSGFVDNMATSLSIYATNNGYSNSFNFYKKLCWTGLFGTSTFQTLYPKYIDPNDEVNNPNNYNPAWLDIINTAASEQNNSVYDVNHPNGNTYEFIPQGNAPNSTEPCD